MVITFVSLLMDKQDQERHIRWKEPDKTEELQGEHFKRYLKGLLKDLVLIVMK